VRTTQQFSITLPNEIAEAVKSKVAAGEYATERGCKPKPQKFRNSFHDNC
jgi:hypothetical protein